MGLHRPPLNPCPDTTSSNTTPTNTPTFSPKTTPIKLQLQKSLTLPLSETEFLLTPFIITPTHSPPPPHPQNPHPTDIDPILLRNINEPQSRKPILFPTSNEGRRRHSQFDPSLPFLKLGIMKLLFHL